MNKIAVLTGTAGFLLGIGCGFFIAPNFHSPRLTPPVLTELTSQGRAEVQKMVAEINTVLDEDIGEIMAEKTQMLQAISAKEPDRNAADFYLSGMEDKMNRTQAKINRILLNAVQNMPLIDRRTYMKFYVKNRSFLKLHSIVLPSIIAAEINDSQNNAVSASQSQKADPS